MVEVKLARGIKGKKCVRYTALKTVKGYIRKQCRKYQ